MSIFITIAGPQSSGKTTAINFLRKKHDSWYFVDPIDPYTVASKNHRGGIYADKNLQINMMEIELIKIRNLEKKYNPVFVIESGIFRLVYANYYYNKKLAVEYQPRYMRLYNELNPYVIFINTPPEVSFVRRKERYVERIMRSGINDNVKFQKELEKYKKTIYKLYPHWQKFYQKIPYPKTVIENSKLEEHEFIKKIDRTISSLLDR